MFRNHFDGIRPHDRNVERVHDNDRDDQGEQLVNKFNRDVLLFHKQRSVGQASNICRKWDGLFEAHVFGRIEVIIINVGIVFIKPQ